MSGINQVTESPNRVGKILLTGASGFIGSHLVQHLESCGYEFCNVDIVPPKQAEQLAYYRSGSILDGTNLKQIVSDYQPTCVIHLAALAVMDGKSIDDFRANTDGTANLLEAVKNCPSVERLIITSTQHVRRPGSSPATHDEDYDPLMLYGESKVITEQLTRKADLKCAWTIVRPTTVWGPGHLTMADGLLRLMSQGRYIHPAKDPVLRSYGYVKNVAWQLEQILLAEKSAVDRKTFYVADANMRQLDWVNNVSVGLTGRPVRTVPLNFIFILAKLGDILRSVGLRFPMYSSRLENLTSQNHVPIEPTLQLLGPSPIGLDQGIQETVAWFNEYRTKKVQ